MLDDSGIIMYKIKIFFIFIFFVMFEEFVEFFKYGLFV